MRKPTNIERYVYQPRRREWEVWPIVVAVVVTFALGALAGRGF